MDSVPANQKAMASTLAAVAKGRPKSIKQHLEAAEEVMSELRTRGFRLVPFPPLNTMEKVRARVARAKAAAKGKRARKNGKNGK